MNKDEEPFITPLMTNAIQVFELYSSFMKAGFDKHQALDLVKTFIAQNPGGKNGKQCNCT